MRIAGQSNKRYCLLDRCIVEDVIYGVYAWKNVLRYKQLSPTHLSLSLQQEKCLDMTNTEKELEPRLTAK